MILDVIIPAFNESQSIGEVLSDIDKSLVRNIYVVDNNSSDDTAQKALQYGAIVLKEPVPGYGKACLKGIQTINNVNETPDAILFLDGDYSDYPNQAVLLVTELMKGFDLVIGSRALGKREKGSMTIPQLFGNWLATKLIRLKYGFNYTDLGPFRLIRYDALKMIKMEDEDFGWTVEMQIKALKHQLKISEVPVDYRKRIGKSKISGTIKGVVMAGYKIIYTILKY